MRNLNRVHLHGLRVLESVGRLGGLAAAAAELGVTVGAVSQQVRKAEEQVGLAVFERTAAGLRPTAAGRRLLDRLTVGLQILDEALVRADPTPDNTLVVSVAPVFAAKWLVPRLTLFNDAHPDFRIRIDADSRNVDLAAAGVDVAIRVGRGGWPEVRAERLIEQIVFPVCSPRLQESLRAVGDLRHAPIVRERTSLINWDIWLEPHGLQSADLPPGPVYSDAALCLDATIAGQGVMLAWQTLAHDALAQGQVVRPFPASVRSGIGYYLVTPPSRRPSPAAAAFIDWVRAEIRGMDASYAPGVGEG
ncbi:MAG: LysR substrate-binding domain-containing protein [Azospirillaceae bacterium]